MRSMRTSLNLTSLTVLAVLAGCNEGGLPNPAGTFETTAVDIAPVLSGRVLSVTRAEGERVSRGDTLLVIDTELIALQRAEAAAGQAALRAQRRVAEADLARPSASWLCSRRRSRARRSCTGRARRRSSRSTT